MTPEVISVALSIDGGADIDLTDSLSAALPYSGEANLLLSHLLPDDGEDHEFCVTVTAQDASGTASVTECVDNIRNEAPIADAGSDLSVEEGSVVTLDGSASLDPDGDPVTYKWELASYDGPPLVIPGDAFASTSVQSLDDGTYTFRLTVSDGDASSTDEVVVAVTNADPVVVGQADAAAAGGVTLVTAQITDGGVIDTHSATVSWGDGSDEESVGVVSQGTGWASVLASHVYGSPGSYTATLTMTDDDGAEVETTLTSVNVSEPVGVWATSESGTALNWTGSSNDITGLVHTNSAVFISGWDLDVHGTLQYVTSENVYGVTIDSGPNQVSTEDPPIAYDIADYEPGGTIAVQAGADYHDETSSCSSGLWTVSSNLEPGLYYADCDISVGGYLLEGDITMVATGKITIGGTTINFNPYADGLLFLSGASGDDAILIQTYDSTFLGHLIAAEGEVALPGSQNRFLCGLVGNTVDLHAWALTIEGSDCVRPQQTNAPPLLVPDLDVQVAHDVATALPGDPVTATLTVEHNGAELLVPGIVGLQNLDESDVTVSDITVVLEAFDLDDDTWSTVSTTLTAVDNPATGVTYAAGFDDTVVEPGAVASWGIELQATLSATTMNWLLDDAEVGAIRVRTEVSVDESNVPVRSLYRFGDDIAPSLRTQGDVTDITVTLSTLDGQTRTITQADQVELEELAPGDTVSFDVAVDAPQPDPIAASETAEAYLGRLRALDGRGLGSLASARGTGSLGPVLAEQVVDVSTVLQLPIVDPTVTAPDRVLQGDPLSVVVSLSNTASASAVQISGTAELDGVPSTLAALPTTLVVGGTATDSTDFDVDPGLAGSIVRPSVELGWSDEAGNSYGPLTEVVSTRVDVPGAIAATLVDLLVDDADRNGLVSAGDTVRYTASLTNTGTTTVQAVTLSLPLDTHTDVVSGSTTTTQGTVTSEGATVALDLGDVAPMGAVSVSFDAQVDASLPASVSELSVQGSITDVDGTTSLTDDPAASGAEDPTTTAIVYAQPTLFASLADVLHVDADLDGAPSQGDTLRYLVDIANTGLATANDVVFTVNLDPGTALVVGSVVTGGTVTVTGQTVQVDLGDVDFLSYPMIQLDVTVTTDVPTAVLEVQGTITSTGLSDVLTDDPKTVAEPDPTLTVVGGDAVAGNGGGDPAGGPDEGETYGDLLVGGPTVDITAPQDGARVGSPTDITATVTVEQGGAAVATWKTVRWPLGGTASTGTVLDEGTGTPPAVVGQFDPTLSENGMYLVRLEVTDVDGYIGRDTVAITVEGAMKLGSYDVAYMDAEWDSSIFQARLVRSYSTLRKDDVGDFGHGWELSMGNIEVFTNGPLGQGGWQQESCGVGAVFVPICTTSTQPHIVVVRWPGGQLEVFDMTPAEGSSFFSAIAPVAYTARAGTNSTLAPIAGDQTITVLGNGNVYSGFGSEIYDPQRYLLTDNRGIQYLLDVDVGLVQTTDRNGNRVVYGPDGIFPDRGVGVQFVRDAENRITEMTLPRGSITYTYDGAGDLVSVTDEEGAVAEFTYDSAHRLVSYGDQGEPPLAVLTYDADGRLIQQLDPDGVFVTESSDLTSWTSTMVGPDPALTTTSTFDADGQLVEVVQTANGEQRTTSVEYTDYRLTKRIGVAGDETTFAYDEQGRVTQLVDADGVSTELVYDAYGSVKERYLNGRLLGSTVFDENGNPIERHGPNGELWSSTTYNEWGAPIAHEDADLVAGEVYYDALGQLNGVAQIDKQSTTSASMFTMPGAPPPQASTVTLTRTFSFVLGPDGEIIGVDDGTGVPLVTVNERGQIVSYLDENFHEQQWEYNGKGDLVATVDKVGNRNTFTYTNANKLQTETTRLSQTITYTYKTLTGWLKRVEGPDAWVEYSYNPWGEVTAVENETALVEISRDWRGYVSTVTTTGTGIAGLGPHTVTYHYADSGRLESVETDYGTQAVVYDDDGIPAALIDSNVGTWSYTWRDDGPLETVTAPDGRVTTYSYTPGLRLSSIGSVDAGGGSLQSMTLEYDPFGKVIGRTDQDGEHLYDYTPEDRLASVDHPVASPLSDEAYDYDALGNRISSATNPAPAIVHDAGDRLISDATFNYRYDQEGRLIEKEERATSQKTYYDWNSFDELLRVRAPDLTTEFWYDGLGRRVQVDHDGTISRFVYDGLAPLAVLEEHDQLVSWNVLDFWGDSLGEWSPTYSRQFFHDQMWTRTGWLDGSGLSWEARDSFGNPLALGGEVEHQALTWHSQDPTGLMYMGARYMDPEAGRFISEDPWASGDQYSYALNDPMNHWDPFGAVVAITYGITSRETSEGTKAGAVPLGCRIRCILFTTASGVALGLLGDFDAINLVVDWAECAFSANPGFCFPADTPIATPLGPRPIQDIRVGDKVIAYEDEGTAWVTLEQADQ